MKITPHTIFVYASGPFLRVVRGEHPPASTTVKPRVYRDVTEALEKEHRPRILNLLSQFPSDRLIDRRLKTVAKPVKIAQVRTLAEAIRSSLFTFAQLGVNSKHQEVGYVYHRSPSSSTGIALAATGKVSAVRQLLKKYKRPEIRDRNYEERKPRVAKKEIA